MTADLIVYGPVFCDLIFTGLATMPKLGAELFADDLTLAIGGSAIVAVGLARLGARVGLIADLGQDPLSQVAWQLLGELGLDRSLIRRHAHPLPRVTVALSFPHDRAFVTRFQTTDQPVDLADVLRARPARHVHLCSFLAALETPNAGRIAHQAGATVSLDPGWDERSLLHPRLAALIAELDVFLPSRGELCHIAQTQDLEPAARRVLDTMRGGVIVVKDGPAGAWLYSRDRREPLHASALPVNPVDTTGAGDAFDAGFLYAFLRGLPQQVCLRYGVICGGLATTAPGGTTALPTLMEVEDWLSR